MAVTAARNIGIQQDEHYTVDDWYDTNSDTRVSEFLEAGLTEGNRLSGSLRVERSAYLAQVWDGHGNWGDDAAARVEINCADRYRFHGAWQVHGFAGALVDDSNARVYAVMGAASTLRELLVSVDKLADAYELGSMWYEGSENAKRWMSGFEEARF